MTPIQWITVDRLQLAARTSGERTNPCLVLLHGWPQTGFAWEPVLGELGRDFYTLAFDLPGVGDSRGAPPTSEKHRLADLVLKATETAGGTSVIVVGYDVGGMIAFACARDHAARIDGAIVMNTVIPGLDPWSKVMADPRIWHFAFHKLSALPELLISGHERAYFDFFYDVMAGDPARLTSAARDTYARGYSSRGALTAGLEWYRALDADAAHNNVATSIDTPILYLRGDADGRRPEEYAAGLRAGGATRVLTGVLSGSGEYAPEEAPAALIAAIRAFRRHCTLASEDGAAR